MVTPRRLDVYEAAYLAGGPRRVVDTAVVALVETGRVRAQTAGDLQVVQDSPPARGRGARAGQARGAELGTWTRSLRPSAGGC